MSQLDRVKFSALFFFILACVPFIRSQTTMTFGPEITFGKQSIFPFNSGSYTYHYKGFGLNFYKSIRKKGQWEMGIRFQPIFYQAKHQLINRWYMLDERDQNYAAKIPIYLQEKIIKEYALNIAFLPKYHLRSKLAIFGIINVGPMYSDTETERLAKGIAFSDILGLGLEYTIQDFQIMLYTGIRHVSNANLRFPNNGHNASFISLSAARIIQ